MKYASIFQNDYVVEHEVVDHKDLKKHFEDSFKYHTGNCPSNHQINVYLSGQAVVEIQDNLSSTWQAIEIGEIQ